MPGIRRIIQKKLDTKQDVPRAFPGLLGNNAGVVSVPDRQGFVYVRLLGVSGEVLVEAYNSRVPATPNLPVLVGYDPLQPTLFQVLSTRVTVGPGVTSGGVTTTGAPLHHTQHEYPQGTDIVWVQLMQILPFRVFPGTGLTVRIYRGMVFAGGAWRKFEPATGYDLTSYVPTTSGKARFVLLTLDSTASLVITPGSEVDLDDLSLSDIPSIPSGTSLVLAAIRLYYGQTQISESVTTLDIIDLRFPHYYILGGTPHDPVSLDSSLSGTLSLSGQELSALPQAASTVLAGPTSGPDAIPTFRSLTPTDIQAFGGVVGPTGGVVDGHLAVFDGSSGLVLKDGGAPGTGGGSTGGDVYWFVGGVLNIESSVASYVVPRSLSIESVYISCLNSGTSGSTTIDVHRNGTTIFTTQSNRPTLPYNSSSGYASSIPDSPVCQEGDRLTLDIDDVASGASGLAVVLAVTFDANVTEPGQVYFVMEGILETSLGKLRAINLTGRGRTLQKAHAYVNTPPTGSSILIDLKLDNTSILSSPLTILPGESSGLVTSFTSNVWGNNSSLTVDVTQVGSGNRGEDLMVTIVFV